MPAGARAPAKRTGTSVVVKAQALAKNRPDQIITVNLPMVIRLIGTNCPALISPGRSKIGIMPHRIHLPGDIGVISCVGIGGDPIIGSSFIHMLALFQTDPNTAGALVIGDDWRGR